MYSSKELIWITWENHRRTNELSRALRVPLHKLQYDGTYVARLLLLSVKTAFLLCWLRPRAIIVQNPSMILTVLVCLLKPLFRYRVIVDRHSAFMFETSDSSQLVHKVFRLLNRYTGRQANLTIVTNDYLKRLVGKWGGRGFVLQDKLPDLIPSASSMPKLSGKHNITYICSFLKDEPVAEVLKAAALLDPSIAIYITGDHQRYTRRWRHRLPRNVVLTGFLPQKEFNGLLRASDAILVLTKREHTLLCGAYEAVSLGKPLILSRTQSLLEYFKEGPVYTENGCDQIAEAVRRVLKNKWAVARQIRRLAERLDSTWTVKFRKLVSLIDETMVKGDVARHSQVRCKIPQDH